MGICLGLLKTICRTAWAQLVKRCVCVWPKYDDRLLRTIPWGPPVDAEEEAILAYLIEHCEPPHCGITLLFSGSFQYTKLSLTSCESREENTYYHRVPPDSTVSCGTRLPTRERVCTLWVTLCGQLVEKKSVGLASGTFLQPNATLHMMERLAAAPEGFAQSWCLP